MAEVDDLAAARAVWSDPDRPVAERVRALMGVMTLTEKLAQLGSVWLGSDVASDEGESATGGVAPMQEVFGRPQDWETVRRTGIGHLTRVFGTAPIDPVDGVSRLATLQADLQRESRLGLPAIAHEECLTGFTTWRAAVFPTPLALAATFDPDLVQRVTGRIGADLAGVGVHQGLSPVMDVVRDPRWGRVEESFGEDPYLVGTMGAAYVRGIESAGVVATLKHFAGYAASRAARNHAPVSMGRRELTDVIMVAFEMALRLGGARSVMNSYADIDGVPPAADPTLLTGVLRDDWGFDGTVVSDYGSIGFLVSMHRVARDPAHAGALALEAGIDVELPETLGYGAGLADLVTAGQVDEALVDRALERVLRQKTELGLLDADWTPAAPDGDPDLDSAAHRELAREAATRSVVLLDNDGTLPLDPAQLESPSPRIAVIGPAANDPAVFLGCYSYQNHVLPRHPELGLGIEVPTLLDAVRRRWPDATIDHVEGCGLTDPDPAAIGDAATAAESADLVILAVGDLPGMFGRGSSGEGNDASDLSLPGVQSTLVDAVLATSTPVVVVAITGRPYAMGAIAERSAATIQSFLGGQAGADGIVDVLSGDAEPTGRLPIQIPLDPGGQPAGYLHPVLGEPGLGISSADTVVAYPFGHGLSYTTVDYEDLQTSADQMATDGHIQVSCTVTNRGTRPCREVVQLYVDDPVAEVARPVRTLTGFAAVDLAPGDRRQVTFDLHADRLGYSGRDGRRIVDAGAITVLIGPSSGDLPLTAPVEVTGPTRQLGADRVLDTPAEVSPAATG